MNVPIKAFIDRYITVYPLGHSNISHPIALNIGNKGMRTTILIRPTNPRKYVNLNSSLLSSGTLILKYVEYNP